MPNEKIESADKKEIIIDESAVALQKERDEKREKKRVLQGNLVKAMQKLKRFDEKKARKDARAARMRGRLEEEKNKIEEMSAKMGPVEEN